MIRFFTALCKAMLENLSDEAIFLEATDRFNHHGERCPSCGAAGKMSEYGDYSRYLVSHKDGETSCQRVSPRRFKCKCRTTHALLPDILIPYCRYSLHFMLSVLTAYFERGKTTVTEICDRFEIAISTLYAWKKRFLEQKELLLGVLASRKKPAQDFLLDIFVSDRISEFLRDFFHRYSFSFLQNRSITATEFRPP